MKNYMIHKMEKYIELEVNKQLIQKSGDIVDIMGLGYTDDISKLLLYDSNLNEDFFNLKTGFAGELTQKLVTYRFQTAFVINKKWMTGRFLEFVKESNLGGSINFYFTRAEALNWLLSV